MRRNNPHPYQTKLTFTTACSPTRPNASFSLDNSGSGALQFSSMSATQRPSRLPLNPLTRHRTARLPPPRLTEPLRKEPRQLSNYRPLHHNHQPRSPTASDARRPTIDAVWRARRVCPAGHDSRARADRRSGDDLGPTRAPRRPRRCVWRRAKAAARERGGAEQAGLP